MISPQIKADKERLSHSPKEAKFKIGIWKGKKIILGESRELTWAEFTKLLMPIISTSKDDVPLILPAAVTDGHHPRTGVIGARRRVVDVEKRTLLFLDVDCKETDERKAPQPLDIARQLKDNWGGAWALYTSHSNSPLAPRYRIVFPIDPAFDVPAGFDPITPIAERLGVLPWLDRGKIVENSLFHLRS